MPATFDGKIDLGRWIAQVEAYMTETEKPREDWANYALQHHIADPIRNALERIRRIIIGKVNRNVPWSWNLLKVTLVGAQAQIDNASLFDQFKDCHRKHKTAFIVAETGLAVCGFALLAPFAIISGLGAIGFSAAGPVAGSLAAAIQSSIGLVEAGSAFALAQSVTMTPAIIAAASSGAVVGAGAITAGVTGLAYDVKTPPSVTWEDGENFQPCPELIEILTR